MKPHGRWVFQTFASRGKQPRRPESGIEVKREAGPAPEPFHLVPRTPRPLVKLDLEEAESKIWADKVQRKKPPTIEQAKKLLGQALFELRIRESARRQGCTKKGDLGDYDALVEVNHRVAVLRRLAWDGTGVQPDHPGTLAEFKEAVKREALKLLAKQK